MTDMVSEKEVIARMGDQLKDQYVLYLTVEDRKLKELPEITPIDVSNIHATYLLGKDEELREWLKRLTPIGYVVENRYGLLVTYAVYATKVRGNGVLLLIEKCFRDPRVRRPSYIMEHATHDNIIEVILKTVRPKL